ncbi:MAG TPA: isocitrate lyase/phosphoenolpyruvate mutase family protein [Actinophytocola sp.]|uniref:isocitrate lyase/PEP mutase family protein n=1 Tax=Actinophytocola sp. TaxID=1872138 RepID=UPI002DDD10F0|nr:isocitrate lyase/phosphoenolpyruvate mutase family protein [Actinophytocola sp.]HEV2782367.1 isocitrate lyase/phosphoenolpyruvate mutase family protein [Actinophytocola sp.]
MTQRDKAELFGGLHRSGRVLILPNAWDVASARIVEEAGAAAVATTSAGVAWSLGAPDGGKLGRDAAVAAITRIADAVRVPVTADIEGGYAVEPDEVAESIRLVWAAGAVGVNLEDGAHDSGPAPLLPAAAHAERVAAAKQAAPHLFVNARIDTYLRGVGDPADRLADVLARAAAYLAAGADGIFVPGVRDESTIATLVREIDAPLNVLAGAGSLPVPTLADLGVARVSVGGSLTEVAYAAARRCAEELLTSGTYRLMDGAMTYPELNALVGPRP